MNEAERLLEAVKSQRNRCAVAVHLIHLEAWDLVCTLLEDIHYFAQTLTEEFCIKREDKDEH